MKDVNDYLLANKHWARYQSAVIRGHGAYQRQAKLCENFYLGGGRQWADEDKAILEESGKPWLEENVIFSTINTVIGYQTQSRMDIAYKPREEDDQGISDILTKLAMYITDSEKYPWKESEVFSDGLIQQRGYFNIDMDFNENSYGDIKITVLDPLDVIPDQDAKSYNPDDWGDVIITSWMSFDDVKSTYGLTKWRAVEKMISNEPDFGYGTHEQMRNKFGTVNSGSYFFVDETGMEHVRLINRQYWKLTNREFFFDPSSGDTYPVPESMTPKERKAFCKAKGLEIISKTQKRIRWTVSTRDVVLHDAWSPYEHFTVVPYFPYFRRGVTVGLVDNLIKTQEMLNKVYSQILNTINTTANSGWLVEESSLVNMEVDDLEYMGGRSGVVLEYKKGFEAPQKIEPNTVPTGLKEMITSGIDLIRLISGVSETFQGGKGPEVSGTAIQSRVHQSAIQLAAPIDNLFRTRNMIAERVLKLIQAFYTQERTYQITGPEGVGMQAVTINQQHPDDPTQLINDVTVGKYDVVIADVPTQITFQNAQFSQAIEMRKFGVMIPDAEMVKMSTLSRKNEIAKMLEGPQSEQAQQQALFQQQLQLQEMQSKSKEADAKAIASLGQVAASIAENPATAIALDSLIQTLKQQEAEEIMQQQVAQNPQVPQQVADNGQTQ